VIVKHTNPCGAAERATLRAAWDDALAGDPISAFGGVIAANREVDLTMAEQVAEVFTEVVVAPSFTDDALAVLQGKKNIRLLRMPAASAPDPVEFRPISGGLLMQSVDRVDAPGDDPTTWTLVAGEPLDAAELDNLVFAWRSVRAVKSNAILLAHDKATVGVGMGQVNRVDSARLAVSRAGDRAAGSVAASDAFFPFADGLQVLLDAGVRAVVQPGGSVRDAEVIEAAAAAGVPMYLTGTRHFAH
jgi:phosphoribosylaminoimidazolecarboxamide formyltransferase/IMP cyclohydrolase